MSTRSLYIAALLCVLATHAHAAGPATLFSGAHAGSNAVAAVNAVFGATGCGGSSCVDNAGSGLYIDGTSCDPNSGFINYADFVADATNTGNTEFSIQACASGNHAPYHVLNTSLIGYSLAATELTFFSSLESGAIGWSHSFVAVQPTGTPPGIHLFVMTSIGGNGVTGSGVEFTMSAGYKGLDTTYASFVAGDMAGFLASIQNQHPTWTWGDIKGAFRQTASNWVTGYNIANYGYGTVNYDGATAIASPAAIYLQGPIVQASVNGSLITLTVYPFRQTRRAHEEIYAAPATYSWPVKNEYTTADLTTAGVVLIWNDTALASNTIPASTVSLPSLGAGRWNVIGFTTDGSGAYSRVESWSAISIAGACL